MPELFTLADFLDIEPFSLAQEDKCALYVSALSDLTQQHYERCPEYRRVLKGTGFQPGVVRSIEDIPFIPVRLFKKYDLVSIDRADIVKTMTSSGTSGQSVSRISLDKASAANQSRVLTKVVSSFTGKRRRPMLVIDSRAVVKDRRLFSARGAGILGFSMLGYDVTYALDEQMQLDQKKVEEFLDRHKGNGILIFGFTSLIWEHFYMPLKSAGMKLALEDGVMIHGGGWKKLSTQAVDRKTFNACVSEVCGVTKIHNYYGMIEQTGSIFVECEAGHLHASVFSDVIVRDHRDFSALPPGRPGLVQLLSLLPSSYPGHSILSEDVGEIVDGDECSCGRKGRRFRIHGRIENAEVRGCSDAYGTA